MIILIYGCADFAGIIFRKIVRLNQSSIIGANFNKLHLVSYNSHTYNKIQQYSLVKNREAPPK